MAKAPEIDLLGGDDLYVPNGECTQPLVQVGYRAPLRGEGAVPLLLCVCS